MSKKLLSKLPLLILLATIICQIGFAAVTPVNLSFLGTATASIIPNDKVYMSNVVYSTNTNANINESKIINYYQNLLQSKIVLSPTDPLSHITYTITVHNPTEETYYFEGILYDNTLEKLSNTNITFTYSRININDSIQPNETKTFNLTFHYKDNQLNQNNILESYLNISFKKKYTITYTNLNNTTTYPTEIFEGNTLVLDLTNSNPMDVHIYINNNISEEYTFINKVLTIENVTGNITIQGTSDNHYDVPVTENDNQFTVLDETTSGNQISINDLFNVETAGINGSSKTITRIDVIISYTSTTGSKQSVVSTLTHNNTTQQQTLQFEGKTTNGTLTISFNNLQILTGDTFNITNTNDKITNGNVQIHKEEVIVYLE